MPRPKMDPVLYVVSVFHGEGNETFRCSYHWKMSIAAAERCASKIIRRKYPDATHWVISNKVNTMTVCRYPQPMYNVGKDITLSPWYN